MLITELRGKPKSNCAEGELNCSLNEIGVASFVHNYMNPLFCTI